MRKGVLVTVVAVVVIAAAVFSWQRSTRRAPKGRPDAAAFARQQLWNALQPVTLASCDLQRLGESQDGGYLACANLLGGAKAGYSYGISGYDGWGCEVATRLNVPVHQYDCFDTRRPACAAGTVFHAECIGIRPETIDGRAYDSLERQLAANGDAASRILMKIDVEGAEWDVFLTTPDNMLDQIDQLVVEFHGTGEARFLSAVHRLRQYFHVANLHMNNHACTGGQTPFGAWAYEVLFVNKRLTGATAEPRATPYHPLDRPNSPAEPDCQTVAP
jgi:Methyltransferase FkbM domain